MANSVKNLKKSTKIVFGVIAVVIVAAIAVGIVVWNQSGKETAADDYTFRYILNNHNDITPIDFAIEQGLFEAEGVKVEAVGAAVGGGANTLAAVAAGTGDIGFAAPPAEINAVASGAPIKIIYGGPACAHEQNQGYQILVRPDSTISSAKDLVGKTLAVTARGAMMEFFTRIYLTNAGISPSEVELLLVPGQQHAQVLESKQVDAIAVGTPFADDIIANGVGKPITDLYHVLGNDLAGTGWGYFMNTDTLAKYPEGAKKVVSALIKADEWVVANPDEAREVVKKILARYNQNPELAKYWYPEKLVNHGLWEDKNIQYWIDFLVADGKLQKDQVKPSDIYTNEYNPYYNK